MLQDTAMLLHHYGYLVIFVVLAIEGTGMPGIPLEMVFLGAGYLIQRGQMSFELAVVAAALGNVFGNLAGYVIGAAVRALADHRRGVLDRAGRQGGRRGECARGRAAGAKGFAVGHGAPGAGSGTRKRRPGDGAGAAPERVTIGQLERGRLPWRLTQRGLLSRVDLSRTEDWFLKYGAATVFIGRWFGPIRTPAILASGFMGIDIRKYLAASVLASFSWCFTWQLGAWKLGGAVIRLLKPHLFLQMLRLSSWELVAAGVLLGIIVLLALRPAPGGGASNR